jgi:hypothetical protein
MQTQTPMGKKASPIGKGFPYTPHLLTRFAV